MTSAMQNNQGEQLLKELLHDPESFNNNQFKGYELLNEYLSGFDIETLVPVLEADNALIYRIGISICSELNEYNCAVVLPHLLPLLKIEQDPLYLNYLFSAIYSGTYEKNCGEFYHIIRQLNSHDYKVRRSAMHLMAIANSKQLKESLIILNELSDSATLTEGLAYLIKSSEMNKEFVIELIQSDREIIQLFGGIIARKLFDRYPDLIMLSAKSLNNHLSAFSREVIKLNSEK
jgi:hypothetical protein